MQDIFVLSDKKMTELLIILRPMRQGDQKAILESENILI